LIGAARRVERHAADVKSDKQEAVSEIL